MNKENQDFDTNLLRILVCPKTHTKLTFDNFKLELISPIRRGICHMKGMIFANGNLMTEGELMAQIIKRNES